MELKNQIDIPFYHLSIRNHNQFIDNTYPDMSTTRELDDHVVEDILFDLIISVQIVFGNGFECHRGYRHRQ